MARLEAQAAERVIEACVRTESVRKCVFTSSLLACMWRQNYPHDRRFPTIIDENCWSDESFCRDNRGSIYHRGSNRAHRMPAMQSRDFKREETLNYRGWLGRCAGDAGAVVQSPLAAAAAPTSGEQWHQQDWRKNELSGRSDGRDNPGSGEAAAPVARRRTSPPATARSDGRKD